MPSQSRMEAYRRSTVPKLLRWDVNSKCNLACAHCCVGESLRDDTILDLSTEEFLASIREAAARGVESVHYLGGEPTIRKDFLTILEVSAEAGLNISFNTNGIRQDQKYIDKIFETGVRKVVVSLDGPDVWSHELMRGAGTFAKTCSFVGKLAAAKKERNREYPLIQIQAVITSAWADRARDMVDLCRRIGAGGLKVTNLSATGDALQNYERLAADNVAQFRALVTLLDCVIDYPDIQIDVPAKPKVYQFHRKYAAEKLAPMPFGCPAVHDNVHVGPDGDISPCQLAASQNVDTRFERVNIKDGALDSLTASERFNGFHETVQKPDNAVLYKHQIPCNRCEFNGLSCNPCPLPGKTGYYPTNYMCLIAEWLNDHVASGEQPDWDTLEPRMKAVVMANPPRAAAVP
ncbi:MAG TPA: radical SAM protein [Aurantimonas sp.]